MGGTVPPRRPSKSQTRAKRRVSRAGKRKRAAPTTHGKERLAAEHQALLAIVQESRDALWTWTRDGKIVRWNAAAERLFGYTQEEIVGQSIFRLIPLHRHRLAKEAVAKAARGQAFRQYETVRVHKDGAEIEVDRKSVV